MGHFKKCGEKVDPSKTTKLGLLLRFRRISPKNGQTFRHEKKLADKVRYEKEIGAFDNRSSKHSEIETEFVEQSSKLEALRVEIATFAMQISRFECKRQTA